jgi:hypothetical protein
MAGHAPRPPPPQRQRTRSARAERPFADVASGLIGVTSLFTAGMLVEIDAVVES